MHLLAFPPTRQANIIRVASLSPKRRKQGLGVKCFLPAIVNMGIYIFANPAVCFICLIRSQQSMYTLCFSNALSKLYMFT